MVSQKHLAQGGFAILLTLILMGAIYYQFNTPNPNKITSLPDFGEVEDFTLPSIDGDNFTFSSTDGEIRLVWFVYTKCQQGCSILTAKLDDVYNHLQEEGNAKGIHLITIDFDYRFDSMQNLTDYSDTFSDENDTWEFLLGNENQTKEVTSEWNFYFELDNSTLTNNTLFQPQDGDSHANHTGHEVVYIHSFILYIVDQHSHLRRQFLGLDWTRDEVINVLDFLKKE